VTPRSWLATAVAMPAVLAGFLIPTSPASALVGGTDATRAYRFHVDVQRQHPDGSFSFTCGGNVYTVDGETVILTQAACVTDPTAAALPADQIRLAVGSTTRDAGRIIPVTSIRPFAGWDWGAPGPDGQFDQVNDGAVLIPSTTRGLPAPIDITHDTRDTRLRLMGWGSTKETGEGPLPDTLQQLDGSTIVDPANCVDSFISRGEICVQSPPRTGTCKGDAGSGGVVRDHGTLTLRATASRIAGETCGTDPAVFTDWPYFRAEVRRLVLTNPTPHRTTGTTAPAGARYDLWPTFTNPVK
jgi:hypothetical protein